MAPHHRTGFVEVRDGDGEGSTLYVVHLVIIALELAQQRLGETFGGRAGKPLVTILRRMYPVANPARARGFGICSDRLDPAVGALFLDKEVRRDVILPDDQ